MGHSPKRVLAWGPRRDTRPAGERRSGGALGVAYPIGIATRHGAKPATTRTHKRNAPPARRTGRHPAVTPRRRQATTNYPPPGRRTVYAFAKGPAVRRPRISRIKYINPQFVKIPYACACARACAAACALGRAREALPQNFLPKAPAKTAPFPREAPAKNRKIKNFQKNLPKQAGICRPDCVLY